MKVESCVFNMDTVCIDIIYENGGSVSLYIPLIEESLVDKVLVFPNDRIEIRWKFVDFTAGI